MLQTITKVYKQTNKRLAFYLHYLKRNMFICSEFKKIKVNDHFLLLHWTLISCYHHPLQVQTSQKQGTFLLLQKLTKMVNAIYSLGHRHLFCSRGICLNTSPQQYIIDVNWFLFLISFTWTSSCTYAAVIVLKRSLPGVSLMSKSKNNIKIFFFYTTIGSNVALCHSGWKFVANSLGYDLWVHSILTTV